uniref:ATP synthase subunit delta n=1 Tax=Acidithiobacillus ferridurans TaxID=1232575 RepID=ATPD_ACIFI|nr:RecName: Full=ATP synthase subunit delta; AltName: Full=ATP synthase F(1) sector subunit delta; AltName: Full=F-type ATPase subunit delta; Short=F-ATPase subunit delta [Acidithiobacillus ferridurans]AAA53124.1 F1F0-ATPase delta subunit [Acidithiobacillus ferridurans]
MADLITVARPYAEALMGWRKRAARNRPGRMHCRRLPAMIADVQAQAFLTDPERRDAEKVSLLSAVPVAVDVKAWKAFLALLIHNDRWPATAEIGTLFADAMRRAEGVVDVLVTSAIALDAGQKTAVQSALERRFAGHKVRFREAVDAALIGGLVIHTGDLTIDASVRGQVQQLARTLRS